MNTKIDESKKPFCDYFLCNRAACIGVLQICGFGPELEHWADYLVFKSNFVLSDMWQKIKDVKIYVGNFKKVFCFRTQHIYSFKTLLMDARHVC